MQMKKIVLLMLAAAMMSSCSYLSQVNLSDTTINFRLLDIRSSYALVEYRPSNDYTMYLTGILLAEDFDNFMLSGTEAELQEKCLKDVAERYASWREHWTGRTDKYVADLAEHEYLVSTCSQYFLELKPDTEYCVLAFCVNPKTSKPLGPLQKFRFSTLEPQPLKDKVDFDFMIRDNGDGFCYYVRPSLNGKIWYDGYFSTVFKVSDYMAAPYSGDIRAYLKKWVKDVGSDLEYFLSVDITRYEAPFDLVEGVDYTIVGCPYQNLGDGRLTLLDFTYSKDLNTPYRHDRVIE